MARPAKRHWLLKSEPGEFSFADLLAAPGRRTFWDGVRNYQARNSLRDDFQVGDAVLFYHSNAEPAGVVGLAEVASRAYPDATQFDPDHPHFDPKARPEAPVWYGVEIVAVRALPRVVTLPELKRNAALADMGVLRRGNRLSVQAVEAAEFAEVLRMASRRPR